MYETLIKIKGTWDVKLYGQDGGLKDHRFGHNVITTNGKEFLASYLRSAAVSTVTNTLRFIAVGTGSTTEAASDTGLGSELTRVSGGVSYTSGAIYELVATFAAGVGTGAIAEYGLYNTATGGTLFSRDTETVINKGASDSLVVTHQITLS